MKKRKQALVIGLGQFGMSLARELTRRGMEVLAADKDLGLVQLASAFVDDAMVLDASDEAGILKAKPDRRDVCVCAIGNESRDGSIVCTALLKQFQARYVIARATDAIHAKILVAVGADKVVNPEDAFGKSLAGTIVYENLESQAVLGSDGNLVITELKATKWMIGQRLRTLNLRKEYAVNVVAIRTKTGNNTDRAGIPDPDQILHDEDRLFLVGRPDDMNRMLEKL
jgi:trk system potassium uptake protein TrkA